MPAATHPEAPAAAGASFSPALMLEIELTEPLPAVSYDGLHRRAWVLGRLHGEPVGACIVGLGEDGLAPDQLGALLWPELREPVAERFLAAGMSAPGTLTGDGLAADEAIWPFLVRRREALAKAPLISVVICTRDRPEQLANCLRQFEQQEYPRFEVVVVDNAPSGDAVPAVVREMREKRPGPVTYRYVVEPRPGLSWARNAGIAAAAGEIIAFIDDDEEPDRHWLAGLAAGFAGAGDIGCVVGVIVPARLDTQAQEWFEWYGGHSKGRGFTAAEFSRHGPQSPLFPLPPFGTGANMAFRGDALARIGGFDVAMGAGTPTQASEDTLAFTLVLLAGYRIAYEPAALTRHHHRQDIESLARQLHGYGVGLAAYYLAMVRHRPRVLPALLGLVPGAARYLRGGDVTGTTTAGDLPASLAGCLRRGLLAGPKAYLTSVRTQARVGPSGGWHELESGE